jgi:hypothetical protein
MPFAFMGTVRAKHMLKISIIDRRSQRRLVLEGKLVAPWTAELRAVCARARADLHDRELVVDIKNLIAISQEGENLLIDLMKEGTTFRSRGVFTKHVLAQLVRRARRDVQETTP